MPDSSPQIAVDVAFASDPLDAPTWTTLPDKVTDVAVSARGRSYERDQTNAVSCGLGIDNLDGRFTPGKASSPYYPNVTTDRRMRVRVTPPAPYDTERALFEGFVEKWPVDLGGGFVATSGMGAVDGFEGLNLVTLKSTLAQEILDRTPVAYFPLGESVGTTFGDVAGSNKSARIASIPGEWADLSVDPPSYNLGGEQLAPSDSTSGVTLTATGTGVIGSAANGYGIVVADENGGASVGVTGGFTFSVGFTATPTYNFQFLFAQGSRDGLHVECYLYGDSQVLLAVAGTSASVFATSPYVLTNGRPHQVVATLGADLRTIRLYIDGTLRGTSVSTSDANFGTAPVNRSTLGSSADLKGFYLKGTLAHFALYDKPLTAGDVTALWQGWGGYEQERSGERVDRLLGYAGWPTGYRDIDAGQSFMAAHKNQAGQTVLGAIQDTASAEQGVFFIQPDGTARFQDRLHRTNASPVVTLGTDDLPIGGDLTFELDNSHVVNDLTVQGSGIVVRVTDAPSIARHRRRADSLDLMVYGDNDTRGAAEWILNRYKEPGVRVSQITLDPVTAPALWPWVLTLEVGDMITITGLPDTAPAPSMDFFIESVAPVASSSPTSWTTTLQLSPAARERVWILESTEYGAIDSDNMIAW